MTPSTRSVRLTFIVGAALSVHAASCGSRTGLAPYETVGDGGSSANGTHNQIDAGLDSSLADATTDTTVPRADSGATDTGSDHSVPPDSGDAQLARDAGADTFVPHDAVVDQFATLDAGLTPPRLIAPLSTARVTSRTPTLHWALPDGIPDVTLDLCRDRACMNPIGSPVLVTGTSYKPTTDLPTGVVFWRLHPSIETAVTSATWEFKVGARSAPVDTSWGTTFDVNGDGYPDLVVTLHVNPTLVAGDRTAYVYLGGPTGPAATPSTILPLSGSGDFVPVGDVNGDGYADLAFSVVAGSSGAIYLGGAEGLSATPASTLTLANDANDAGSPYYVAYFASAGDVNGDGYADVVAGTDEVGVGNASAFVQLFLGGPGGLATTPVRTMTFRGGLWGVAAVAGDVNGDGYGDTIIPLEDPEADGGLREFVVDDLYLGGPAGWSASPSVFASQSSSDPEPELPVGTADVNGDGYADVVVLSNLSASAGGAGTLCVYFGSASGIVATPQPACAGIPSGADGFAIEGVATVGDINGDGYSDVIASGLVFLGGPGGLPATPSATAPWGEVYVFAVSAGDINADGFDDVAVIGTDRRVKVYLGGPGGLAATPSVTLQSPGADAGTSVNYVYGATN